MKIKKADKLRESVITTQRLIHKELTPTQINDPKIQEAIIALSRARTALESCM